MELYTEIAPRGEAPAGGMAAVLAWCAAERFTGVLTWEGTAARAVLPMRAGAPDGGADPALDGAFEVVRGARDGRYALTEALPPLEGAEAEHPLRREGFLGPATLADLLRWCEDIALTGTVHVATELPDPRTHAFRYDRGALAAVEVEAWGSDDLGPIFALDRGRFVVRMRSRFGGSTPSQPPPDDVARARLDALRAVRHGLEDLLARRDAASSGRWRRAPPPAPVARPASLPAPPRAPALVAANADSVLVYYLDHRPAPARPAASADLTERLAPVTTTPRAPRPRPGVIALTVLGVVGAVIAGFGLAAGMDLILG